MVRGADERGGSDPTRNRLPRRGHEAHNRRLPVAASVTNPASLNPATVDTVHAIVDTGHTVETGVDANRIDNDPDGRDPRPGFDASLSSCRHSRGAPPRADVTQDAQASKAPSVGELSRAATQGS